MPPYINKDSWTIRPVELNWHYLRSKNQALFSGILPTSPDKYPGKSA